MASTTSPSSTDLVARAQRLQFLTIAWMTVKAAIALGAAWKARSPALFGFGGDSLIELLSEVVVPWRFRSQTETETARSEKIPARIAGGLLFSVAVVCGDCVFFWSSRVLRTPNERRRHRVVGSGGLRHALVGRAETETGNPTFKHFPQS